MCLDDRQSAFFVQALCGTQHVCNLEYDFASHAAPLFETEVEHQRFQVTRDLDSY